MFMNQIADAQLVTRDISFLPCSVSTFIPVHEIADASVNYTVDT